MSEHEYSGRFLFLYRRRISPFGARRRQHAACTRCKIDSLLDVGAGHGAWAAEWLGRGGEGRARSGRRLCPPRPAGHSRGQNFRAHDLATPLDLKQRFDLVQTSRSPSICRPTRPICSSTISFATATSSCSPPRSRTRAASITSTSSRPNIGARGSRRAGIRRSTSSARGFTAAERSHALVPVQQLPLRQ